MTGPVGLPVKSSKPLSNLYAQIRVKIAHLMTGYSDLSFEGKLDTEVPQRSSQISSSSEWTHCLEGPSHSVISRSWYCVTFPFEAGEWNGSYHPCLAQLGAVTSQGAGVMAISGDIGVPLLM